MASTLVLCYFLPFSFPVRYARNSTSANTWPNTIDVPRPLRQRLPPQCRLACHSPSDRHGSQPLGLSPVYAAALPLVTRAAHTTCRLRHVAVTVLTVGTQLGTPPVSLTPRPPAR
ncbi:hypothetical protein K438DRAFT_1275047 [Mycena galopus ATCC 62051]|nr:hypothetical protein K438DRAFT_1275047 [Mycena galopus ATCC 62051]